MTTLHDAQVLIAEAFAKATALSLKPLTVAVLDQGGNIRAIARQDGASNLRPELAIGKAAGALAMGVSSRALGEMAADRPQFVNAVAALAPRGLVPAAGGVLIADASGQCVGAIGVTGDTSDQDEICALHAIEAAGLRALSN